jgi:hypothetical protein
MNNEEMSRLVDKARRDVLLYRILSGKLDYSNSYIREPTQKIKSIGLRVYYDTLKDCGDVLKDQDILIFLIDTKQWSFEEEKKLKDLPKDIENTKVTYYKFYLDPSSRKKYKIEIDYKKKMYSDLFLKRNKYSNMTAQHIAFGAMWFEMMNYMYKGSDKLSAIHYYQKNNVADEDLRSIALSDEWLSYFTASKNPLGKPAIRMTEDQRRLISWTNLYKNCRSNPESPPDNVFNDHDAFDGWLISEKRKDTASKKVNTIQNKNPNASNFYLFGQTQEDIEEIISLNTPEALQKIENEFKST